LWLILNEYKTKIAGGTSKLDRGPFESSSQATSQNIENMINNSNISPEERTSGIQSLMSQYASLAGFSSIQRASGLSKVGNKLVTNVGEAENTFEAFEDAIWGVGDSLINEDRSADDEDLNPFDIYIMYGDFAGDNRANHTIIKLQDVYILGTSQRIEIDPLPVQEVYSFYCRAKI
jgi:hypothetical protein